LVVGIRGHAGDAWCRGRSGKAGWHFAHYYDPAGQPGQFSAADRLSGGEVHDRAVR
jgi:hypothetical protein